ncbi:polymorphic toxin-type HINT domain-containing protein [Microbulbifer sp. SSSA005]|uniref:polymorphic toxin-type HINT domain-containing protein n=1 Tax=Microbulbifer sp. SSSA005 TaxID=3243378 RepID=UPI00403994C3
MLFLQGSNWDTRNVWLFTTLIFGFLYSTVIWAGTGGVKGPDSDYDGTYTISFYPDRFYNTPGWTVHGVSHIYEFKNDNYTRRLKSTTSKTLNVSVSSGGSYRYEVVWNIEVAYCDGGGVPFIVAPGSEVPESSTTNSVTPQGCSTRFEHHTLGSHTVEVDVIPYTPSDMSAPASSKNGDVTLKWSSPPQPVTKYQYRKRINGNGWGSPKDFVSSADDVSMSIGNLGSGKWGFQVRACNNFGCSSYTSEKKVTVVRKPGKPGSISFSPTSLSCSSNFDVNWGAASGGNRYQIRQSVKSDDGSWSSWSTLASAVTATKYDRDGLAPGRDYKYAIRARYYLNGYYSDWSSFTYSDPIRKPHCKPGDMDSPTFSNSNPLTTSVFDIQWSEASGTVDSYELLQKTPNADWSPIQDTASLKKTLGNLERGQNCFKVRATNVDSAGDFSDPACIFVKYPPPTLSVVVTQAPEQSTYNSGYYGQYTIAWQVDSQEVVSAELLEDGQTQDIFDRQTGQNQYDQPDNMGPGDTTHTYQVQACNIDACALSDELTVIVRPWPIPSAPKNFTNNPPTSDSTSYTLTWTAPPEPVDFYIIERDGEETILAKTASSYTFTGSHGSSYSHSISACAVDTDPEHCNRSSSHSVYIRKPKPATPADFHIKSGPDGYGNVTLKWDDISHAFTYDFVLFERVPDGQWREIYRGPSTEKSLDFDEDGTWEYKVLACNSDRCSNQSSIVKVEIDLFKWAFQGGTIPDASYNGISPENSNFHGVLAGSGSVSGGAGNYSIPITLPPGRNKVTPAVSLNYSSRAGNGIAGVGWNISAGSVIAKCQSTYAQDGTQYIRDHSKLCYNGERLRLISGNYGAPGAEYRTEQDSFIKIIEGTDDFIAYHPSGAREYFAREGGKWYLQRLEKDSGNNVIEYEYEYSLDSGVVLRNIYYTGDNSNRGNRQVTFNYTDRSDRSSLYTRYGKTIQNKRLSEIEVRYDGTLIREYTLQYGNYSATSGRSLLRSISECAFDLLSSICREPTTFEWLENPIDYSVRLLTDSNGNEIHPGPVDSLQRHAPHGDRNGDGVRDWPGLFVDAEGNSTPNNFDLMTCYSVTRTFSTHCVEGDFNVDGKTDSWKVQGGYLQIGYTNNTSTGSNWIGTNIPLDAPEPGAGGYQRDSLLKVADYNGDGWPDITVFRYNNRNPEIYLYFHTQNTATPYRQADAKLLYTYQTVGYGCTNPDGFGECDTRSSISPMGDMDGNGLPDFAILTKYSVGDRLWPSMLLLTKQAYSGAIEFESVGFEYGKPSSLERIPFSTFVDVNGDGLPDWVGWMGNSSTLYLRVNKANGNFSAPINLGVSIATRDYYINGDIVNDRDETVKQALFESSIFAMDVDGDGKSELLMPGSIEVEGCSIVYHKGDTEWRCGSDLYGYYHQVRGTREYLTTIPGSYNTNIYKYKALHFNEDENGDITAEYRPTNLIAGTKNFEVIDTFGKGLQDLVFSYGCKNANCKMNAPKAGSALTGKPEGVYINYNPGAATGNENYQPIDLLSAVENGLGVRDEWTYRPLSSGDTRFHSNAKPFYERGAYLDLVAQATQNEHFEFASSMYVVAEHRRTNGVGEMNALQYRYKGAVYSSVGRGFQGFHTIIEEDLAAGIETQSDFHQIFPLAGKLYKQRQWALGDRTSDSSSVKAFKESNFTWQFWPKGGHGSPVVVDALTDSWNISANDPYFVGPKKQSTLHRTLKRSGNSRTHLYTQSQNTTIDRWGNVLVAESRYEEANSSHIVVSTSDTDFAPADEANWWLNKPEQQTVTKKSIQNRKGVSIAANTDVQQSVVVDYLSWDSNTRKPKRVKTTPSSGKWTQVDTVYNSYGHATKVTTSAEGEAKTRIVETTAFSPDHYFPKTIKNVLGHKVTTETSAKFGQPDSVTDANGLTTRYSYDAFGHPTGLTAPSALGLKAAPDRYTAQRWCDSSCDRAPGAVFITIQQQAGAPEQVSYHDQLGRVIRTELQAFDSSDWIASNVTYNALGQTTFESVPHYASSGTSYGTRYLDYDTFGRALHKTVNQTNGQQLDVIYTHEQDSGFTTDILVNGRTMSRTYSGLQQLTETVDALSGTTRYAYDGAGNPIVLQDASGNRITAKYNALGQKEWVDDPNMGSKSFTYTGFGEVETEIDGNLDITSYTYDRLGRMDSRSVNGTEEASWIYDTATYGKGLPAQESRSDASYTRSYSYDALSRPYKVTTAIDGEDFVTQSHFDSNYGRLKGLSYPTGLTLQYNYNSTGYQFRTSNAASDYTYREITQMDAWGEWEFANVAAGNYTIGREFHAETGQMAGTTFDSLVQNHQGIAYSYDNFGNLSERVVQIPSESLALNVENHYYDALNRLDYSTRTDGPGIDYDYDAIGNLLKKDDFASRYSYTGGSNGGPNAVKSVSLINGGTKTYGYDKNGNRTHENGTQQIWYNAFNKPTRIKRNGANLAFYYGADQMRYKQVNQTSGKTTLYIDKLFEKITGGGETQYRYFIGDIAVITTTETASVTTGAIGFTHRDRLGSTVAIGDHRGNLKETHSFDPFGKPRLGNITDKLPSILDSQFTSRGFTDHEHLDDVELIHMNGRAYDYNLGRFLSVDPIIVHPGDSQALNPYSYILNNPLAGTDPSGYAPGDRAYGAGIGLAKAFGIVSPENAEMVIAAELACRICNGSVVEGSARSAEAVVESGKTFIREVAAGVSVTTAAAVAAERAIENRPESGKKGRNGSRGSQSSNGNDSVSNRNGNQQASDIGSQKEVSKENTGGCSFVAGTLVSTPAGLTPIEDVEVGQLVESRDEGGEELAQKPVKHLFKDLHDEVIELSIQNLDGEIEVVITTAEHPFMVFDGDWTPAESLKEGDLIETLEGETAQLVGIRVISEKQYAYNFEVDEFHTYSVGEGQYWVHNVCDPSRGGAEPKSVTIAENGDAGVTKSREYDRPEVETKSGKAVKQKNATNEWDNFLGDKQTNIDPRDGLPDPDRIWSADGERSIRFGDHEMNSKPNKLHYHQETWHDDKVENVLQRIPQ